MPNQVQKLKQPLKSKQLGFKRISGWGGKRSGAGRPNISKEVNHLKRHAVSLKQPLHISMKLKENLPSLRSKILFKEFQKSVRKAKRLGLYVVHFSIQSNHIHLFAETKTNETLSKGMQSLAGRFAKTIRYYTHKGGGKKKGSVFKGRYHLHVLKTPKEVRNALEYVLLNFSKHLNVIEHLDRFSSGAHFTQWKALLGKRFGNLIKWQVDRREAEAANLNDFLSPPRSWLAKEGWMRAERIQSEFLSNHLTEDVIRVIYGRSK
jgi:REP element-mobilizing transposase RayT